MTCDVSSTALVNENGLVVFCVSHGCVTFNVVFAEAAHTQGKFPCI